MYEQFSMDKTMKSTFKLVHLLDFLLLIGYYLTNDIRSIMIVLYYQAKTSFSVGDI